MATKFEFFPSIVAEASVTHRRFSNLSNLAQSLPSTSSSASALVAGSVDFLTAASNHRGHPRGRATREKRNKRKPSDMNHQSKPNQSEVSVRRTQSAFETETKTSSLMASKIETAQAQDESDDEEGGHLGSQSPLLVKRHQSLDVRPSIERHHPTSVSSRSLDRHLEDRGCNR